MAVHIVNPRPAMAATEVTDMDDQRAGGAIDRYYTGSVIQPVDITTTTVGGN